MKSTDIAFVQRSSKVISFGLNRSARNEVECRLFSRILVPLFFYPILFCVLSVLPLLIPSSIRRQRRQRLDVRTTSLAPLESLERPSIRRSDFISLARPTRPLRILEHHFFQGSSESLNFHLGSSARREM